MGASNVDINMNGFRATGDEGSDDFGLYFPVDNVKNISIRNGEFQDFFRGITND